MVATLLTVNVIIIGIVLSGARDHDLGARRLETVRSFYAAEAGMNMAIREMMVDVDEDADGTVGTISDDANDANDPDLGSARVVVTESTVGAQTTLSSVGRSGDARREVQAVLE
jgi:hypothetical protein